MVGVSSSRLQRTLGTIWFPSDLVRSASWSSRADSSSGREEVDPLQKVPREPSSSSGEREPIRLRQPQPAGGRLLLGGLGETQQSRLAALDRREAAFSVAPVFDFNTNATCGRCLDDAQHTQAASGFRQTLLGPTRAGVVRRAFRCVLIPL